MAEGVAEADGTGCCRQAFARSRDQMGRERGPRSTDLWSRGFDLGWRRGWITRSDWHFSAGCGH